MKKLTIDFGYWLLNNCHIVYTEENFQREFKYSYINELYTSEEIFEIWYSLGQNK